MTEFRLRLTLVSAALVVLSACGPTPVPSANTSARLHSQDVPLDEPCDSTSVDCGGGGGTGGGGNPPSQQHSYELRPWDELVAKADRLGLSLGEAASPYIEDSLMGQPGQQLKMDSQKTPAPEADLLRLTGGYPTNARDPQDFVDKLFATSPLVWPNNFPPPDQNPNDPCINTPRDFTSPGNQALNTLEDFPGVIWPGALYQGNSIFGGVGSLVPIPVDPSKRNPLNLQSDTAFSSITVAPTSSAVYTGIGQLMQDAQTRWNGNDPSQAYYKSFAVSSLRELSVKSGLNFNGYGLDVKAKLDADLNNSDSSVYVVFWQTLFNVGIPIDGPRPVHKLFNPSFTVPDLNDLGDHNDVAYDNLPTVIRTVSYGRFVAARYTSSMALSELKASLDAKFNVAGISGTTQYSAHYKRIINNSHVEVVALGGPFDIQKEAFKNDGWKAYFEKTNIPLNTLRPMSFTLQRWDNKPAKISNVLRYIERACPAAPARIRAKVQNWKGTTYVYVTKPGQGEVEAGRVAGDNDSRQIDLTPYLSGSDDTVRIYSEVKHYSGRGGERDAKVTFLVDGEELLDSKVEDTCSWWCASANLGSFYVNKTNGKVEKQ